MKLRHVPRNYAGEGRREVNRKMQGSIRREGGTNQIHARLRSHGVAPLAERFLSELILEKEEVLVAVRQDGNALEFASQDLREDREALSGL